MADNRNMAIDDEAMAKANGGAADVDPYGYLCDGTIGTGTAHGTTNGVETTEYSVDGDTVHPVFVPEELSAYFDKVLQKEFRVDVSIAELQVKK